MSSSAGQMGIAAKHLQARNECVPMDIFIYHNGVISMQTEYKYMGGDVEIYESVPSKEVCLQFFQDKVKALGYSEIGAYIYDFANGRLNLLQTDNDVEKALSNGVKDGQMLEIWVDTMDVNDLIEAEVKVDEPKGEWKSEAEVEVQPLNMDEEGDVGVSMESESVKTEHPVVKPNMKDPEFEFESESVKSINFSDDASLMESDNDGDSKWPIFRAATDMKDLEFTLGMTFATKQEFREAVQSYGFKNGKDIKTPRNDKERVVVECAQPGCTWRIGLRKVVNSHSWRILNMVDMHQGCTWAWENSMVKASVIAKRWAKELKDHPDWMMKKFRDAVCRKEGFYVSDQQAYRAIWRAKKQRLGDDEDNFKRIWSYCAEMSRTNSKTKCIVKTIAENGHDRFLRMYICWEASKLGFKHCRPLIGVDGCHLRCATCGLILTTVSVDANDSIFPLAYAIVEGEKKEAWSWFLTLLKADLEITEDVQAGICFISDKQKGLVPAFVDVLPAVEHKFCVRHLHANMKVAGFQGKALKDALWACARATTLNSYNECLRKLRALDEDAYQWLGGKSPSEWCRSHFPTHSHCDMLVNNICESFNSSLLAARDKPIIECLETIRKMLMSKFFEKRQKAAGWKIQICPTIVGKLKKVEKEAAGYLETQSDFFKFEVA
ncbi:uncharacterized protein LOC116032282 [Ipomoea triloba]|uniref:uncharacterized protein LOC116032282 n=1 Tax=Ipomoea triloba TaxID=35885 RepID=UPI00125D5EDF|nr:uncharacterized protein LOC116032282 [Ipomoea triloba]